MQHSKEVASNASAQTGTGSKNPTLALSQLPTRDATMLVRNVSDRLRMAIIYGELSPGERLNQVQVANQLGVSRMPVREAVAELLAEGLLYSLPHGGAAVRPLTPTDLSNAFAVRMALETSAVRQVADGPSNLDELYAVLAEYHLLDHPLDELTELELDRRFHSEILRATGNSYFRRAMLPIWSTVDRAIVQALKIMPHIMYKEAWKQHREIVDAMSVGDSQLAEVHMREHLSMGAEQLTSAMPALDDSTSPH